MCNIIFDTIGERKCEANAIVTMPEESRELVRDAIKLFLGNNALARFEDKRQLVRDEFEIFMQKSGLDKGIKDALTLIDEY